MSENIIIAETEICNDKLLLIDDRFISTVYEGTNEGVQLDMEQLNKIIAICKEEGLINE
jgi:hypothetical protein